MPHPQNMSSSAGTKVDLGRNAPLKQEGAGTVTSESLAAESYREGGEFAHNEGIHGENFSANEQPSSNASKLSAAPTSEDREGGVESYTNRPERMPDSYAGEAPSYVNNQYIRDSHGPHGKNLKEGDWDESRAQDGIQKALKAEPGSKNDPSRLAEQHFQLKNQAAVGQDVGPGDVKNKTVYDALDSQASA